MNTRLATFRLRVDENWDQKEVIPEDLTAVGATNKSSIPEEVALDTDELLHPETPTLTATAHCKPSSRGDTCVPATKCNQGVQAECRESKYKPRDQDLTIQFHTGGMLETE